MDGQNHKHNLAISSRQTNRPPEFVLCNPRSQSASQECARRVPDLEREMDGQSQKHPRRVPEPAHHKDQKIRVVIVEVRHVGNL